MNQAGWQRLSVTALCLLCAFAAWAYMVAWGHEQAVLDPTQDHVSIAIATTVLHPDPLLPVWLDYHLRWVQHVVIYMDDPSERASFDTLCGERPVTLLKGSQVEPDMTPESRLILRQDENMKNAISYLMERGFTWLVHIDVDELLFGPQVESRAWAADPRTGLVTFTNHEALPVDFETSNPFEDCKYFWINGVDRNQNFLAYGNGKSAVRLGPGVEPDGPHSFSGHSGRALTPPADVAMLLHYPYPSYESWLRKFDFYGRFPDHWFGDRRGPKVLDFMLQSRDAVQEAHQAGEPDKARDFFSKRMLDPQAREQAISQGKIRQYLPLAEGPEAEF